MERFDRYNPDDNKKLWNLYGKDGSKFKVEKGVDFGHAITIHKSQGRTTKNVFFDANTITKRDKKIMENGQQISTERQSLGYVGLSRASENLFVNMGWAPFNEVANVEEVGEIKTPEAPKSTVQETPEVFEVDQFAVTLFPGGKMVFANGNEVTDTTIQNKVKIKKEARYGVLRTSAYNNSNYYVLSDNTILGAGKSNLGKETVKDSTIKERILAKVIAFKKNC